MTRSQTLVGLLSIESMNRIIKHVIESYKMAVLPIWTQTHQKTAISSLNKIYIHLGQLQGSAALHQSGQMTEFKLISRKSCTMPYLEHISLRIAS